MSRALLLIVLLAASARAQVAPPRAPTGGDRMWLVAGALAGGVVASPAGPFLLIGAGAGAYVASALLDLDPTIGGVVLDTAVGTGVAILVGAGTYGVLTEVAGAEGDLSTSIGSVLVGLAVGSAAIGVSHGVRLATLRMETAPALLRTPAGGPPPGLTLSISL
ncbi:hypothetical protein [Rubrivirga marina]|uniref:Uncharacterized protein n=1 Tax=Rubrivirga marina TaxID=1196024 RepID=A0A271IVG8_9BACT|nr:hypothetical protein [Rubrivirga marina]PAP75251.1 hypothetical protein BSZ37_01735 [Rubrivirga marina]